MFFFLRNNVIAHISSAIFFRYLSSISSPTFGSQILNPCSLIIKDNGIGFLRRYLICKGLSAFYLRLLWYVLHLMLTSMTQSDVFD